MLGVGVLWETVGCQPPERADSVGPGHPPGSTCAGLAGRGWGTRPDSCQSDSSSPIHLPSLLTRWQGSQPGRWKMLSFEPPGPPWVSWCHLFTPCSLRWAEVRVRDLLWMHTQALQCASCSFSGCFSFFLFFVLGFSIFCTSRSHPSWPLVQLGSSSRA